MRRGQRVHVDSKTQKNDKNYDVYVHTSVLCSLLRVFVSTYIHVFVF